MKRSVAVFRRAMTALAVGLLSLAATGASAQSFESVFGPTASREEGQDVKAVRFCPGGGFVAVGTSTTTVDNSNVYLVRTRLDGTPLFERLYDVVSTGTVSADRAFAVVEASNGTGFVIAGSTRQSATNDDVLLLKVNCSGVVVWAYSYGGTGADVGFEVIEAQTGNPALGTNRGDIVVAGRGTIAVGGPSNGLLLRTRSDGIVIWNRQYLFGAGLFSSFAGLAEVPPFLTQPTGDIVAAGSLTSTSSSRGYVVRANGNDGSIGSIPQGGVTYGFGTGFNSVVAPQGALVFAGQMSTATGSDVLLVRTGANPATVLAARRIGAANIDGAAFKLREMPDTDLALTGRVGARPGSNTQDAFLLIADLATLQPTGRGQLFGDHGDLVESGASLAVHPNGFVLTGVSRSNLGGVSDQGDLYLVGADLAGRTTCSLPWDPTSAAVSTPGTRFVPVVALPSRQQVRRDVRVISLAAALPVCRP